MPEDAQDDGDNERRLIQPNLYYLYREELDRLDGDSCQDFLQEFIEERWQGLAAESYKKSGREKPNAEDALRALDSLKFSFGDSIKLQEVSLRVLWSYLTRLKFGDLSILFVVLSGTIGFAFWLGTIVG